MKRQKTARDVSEEMRKKMRRKTLAIYVKSFAPFIPMALGLVVIFTFAAMRFLGPPYWWVGLIIGLIIVGALTLWP